MSKATSRMLVALVLAGTCAGVRAQAVQQALDGRWEWTNPEKKCRETMEFKPDGTVTLLSGPGRFEGRYELSARPSARGLYRLLMTAPKNAPKQKDCAGDEESLPEVENGWIWIDPTKQFFMFCDEDNFAYCTAPLRRVR